MYAQKYNTINNAAYMYMQTRNLPDAVSCAKKVKRIDNSQIADFCFGTKYE